jgi:hypothetical protein
MTPKALGRAVEAHGYCHIDSAALEAAIGARALGDWAEFAGSWNRLELDRYMGDGGTYRRRRYACYAVRGARVDRRPHQPHYQTTSANPLNGGIERWFAPMDDATGCHPVLRRLLHVCGRAFAVAAGTSAAHQSWLVEAHQFRVEATANTAGQPTPEGVHRDGVDWVLVCMIGGANVSGAVTTIHDADGGPLDAFTLQRPFEAMILDDHRVRHGVSPVRARRQDAPAYRDVLVLTYRAGSPDALGAERSRPEAQVSAPPVR